MGQNNIVLWYGLQKEKIVGPFSRPVASQHRTECPSGKEVGKLSSGVVALRVRNSEHEELRNLFKKRREG
jgi:hypothetical protein